MASRRIELDSLEPEVLAQILELVSDTSPRSIKAVASTNKYLNSVTKLITWRHLVLQVDVLEDTQQRLESLLNNEHSLGNVRSITLQEGTMDKKSEQDRIPAHQTYEEVFTLLVLFITKIGRLRALNWNLDQTIPIEILQALETHQKQVSLRIFRWKPPGDLEPRADVIALSKSPLLTRLRAVIKGYPATLPDTRELHFQTVVARAPNLEYAGIVNYGNSTARSNTSAGAYNAAFDLPDKPKASMRMLTLDGYQISKQTLDEWSKIVDLSTLRNVKFSRGTLEISYFQNAANMLPNLREISLNLGHVHGVPGVVRSQLMAAAHEYLTTCSPVERLSLWSWKDAISVEELVERHGATLESLQLHEKECISKYCSRRSLNYEELDVVIEKCPKLTDLTIDLKRSTQKVMLSSEDDNMKYFEALRPIGGRLSSLQIYFDAGLSYLTGDAEWDRYLQSQADDPDDDFDDTSDSSTTHSDAEDDADEPHQLPTMRIKGIKPTRQHLMQQYVEDIWKAIYGSHRVGPRLLTVKFGDWESAVGATVFSPERKLVRRFVAKPMERDDQADKCIVTMTRL